MLAPHLVPALASLFLRIGLSEIRERHRYNFCDVSCVKPDEAVAHQQRIGGASQIFATEVTVTGRKGVANPEPSVAQ